MNVYNIDSEFLFYYHVNSISVKSGLLGECAGFDNLSDWLSLPRNSLDSLKKVHWNIGIKKAIIAV